MKVNNPLHKEFPFNVNSKSEFDFHTERLKKLGYIKIFPQNPSLSFPIRFINFGGGNKQYTIY